MTDFKNPDHTGNLEIWLDCPACDFVGLVFYNTQPPIYCSPACKQRAYRRRKAAQKMRNSTRFTHLLSEFQTQGFRGEALAKLERILDRWGPEAAEAAVEVATITARDVREQLRRR